MPQNTFLNDQGIKSLFYFLILFFTIIFLCGLGLHRQVKDILNSAHPQKLACLFYQESISGFLRSLFFVIVFFILFFFLFHDEVINIYIKPL